MAEEVAGEAVQYSECLQLRQLRQCDSNVIPILGCAVLDSDFSGELTGFWDDVVIDRSTTEYDRFVRSNHDAIKKQTIVETIILVIL